MDLEHKLLNIKIIEIIKQLIWETIKKPSY